MITRGDILTILDDYTGTKLAPNSHAYFERQFSKENYFTNARGYRVKKDEQQDGSHSELIMAGCSWALGTGVEYEHCFAGMLETMLDKKISNIAVGGDSLLQIARRVEKEIPFINPKVVHISFGSWHVNRCCKPQRDPISFRPIIKKKESTNDLFIDPSKNPPLWLLRHYAYIEKKMTDTSSFATYKRALSFIAKIFHGYPKKYILRTLNRADSVHLVPWKNLNERNDILYFCLSLLSEISERYNVKVIIQHLYECHKIKESQKKIQENDRRFFEKYSKNHQNIQYFSWESIKQAFKDSLSKEGLTLEHYRGHVFWTDNNHPNHLGHKLIAEAMYPVLKKELSNT